MGDRTGYAPGTFCWVELATTDPQGAKPFYGGLLGWDADDSPAGDGTYTMARIGAKHVAGLYERTDGGPPTWVSYISVADAAATVERATELGATVLVPASDVTDAGRVAILQDPTGAVLGLWEPRNNIGATLVNEPGALVLNQLNTTDPDAARTFYTELFGWRVESVGTDEQAYWGLYNGDLLNGGMMPIPPGTDGISHWLVYFTAADLDTAMDRIPELGGRVLVPPVPIRSGRIAVALDPQGAAFALLEGDVDP